MTKELEKTPPDEPSVRQKKCCGKCAFKKGSQETEDGYQWIGLTEAWKEGTPFYCHESVPGHHQEVSDDRPRWRTCAGWEAHKKTQFRNAMRRIGIDENATHVSLPDEDFDFDDGILEYE
ncbi:hypothetical protein [Sulfitobacter sp. R18_1]|uniref:hypothetical protein n=1 Tax=Sulfitobacter sp. R18_1 TaxID=2821104 RepID=UPI001ADCC972|nr:hypothetical protein [Sulfitobacter sp. R18_1]MBO9428282.1 hypothetical protein [Sulfitobacter sp. R18_1]